MLTLLSISKSIHSVLIKKTESNKYLAPKVQDHERKGNFSSLTFEEPSSVAGGFLSCTHTPIVHLLVALLDAAGWELHCHLRHKKDM